MWPRRKPKPRPAKSVFSAYLRGRMVGASIGLPGEADLYLDEQVPIDIRVAFALGATSKRRAKILSESELERAVRDRLDLARLVDEVEGGGPGSSSPLPPVAPAVPVGVEEAARVRRTPWIGDPLPATGT